MIRSEVGYEVGRQTLFHADEYLRLLEEVQLGKSLHSQSGPEAARGG